MRPRADYAALHTIMVGGVIGYHTGDEMVADVVDNLHLVVGEDVRALRPDVIPRPADDAPRAEWAQYAAGQGVAQDELDNLGVEQIRAKFPPDQAPPGQAPVPGSTVTMTNAAPVTASPPADTDTTTDEPDGTDDVPAGTPDDVLSWVGGSRTRAAMALPVEQARQQPRRAVTDALERLLAG
jgi:hypothetical protein